MAWTDLLELEYNIMNDNKFKATILVVDDEVEFCNIVEAILESHDYLTLKAHNTHEAINILSSTQVDLILIDIILQNESGVEFLEYLQKEYATPPPCLMITGHPKMETAVEVFKLGATDFLKKPIKPEDLVNKIAKTLAKQEFHQQIEQTVMIENGARYIAGYRIVKVIGEGNMGIVYLVEHETEDGKINQYAMKVLKPIMAETPERVENLKQRFLMEARAAFAIEHPNIVRIYNYGTCDNNMPFILMEYCEGKSLDKVIENENLSLEDKCRILQQLAFALDTIHDNDICHRDIKPANVIVMDDLNIKLTDFGIARLRDSTLTMTSEVFGTPAYLAPEAFTSAKVSYKADIFSLGTLAYELFTGQKPFDGSTIAAIARKIQKEDPIWPRKLDRNFPKRLNAMIKKMLAKDPDERYQSAFEIYLEITEFLDEYHRSQGSRGLIERLLGR